MSCARVRVFVMSGMLTAVQRWREAAQPACTRPGYISRPSCGVPATIDCEPRRQSMHVMVLVKATNSVPLGEMALPAAE